MNPKSDPRVFFAAERTLLAWVRTGLTIMALGFVVSRFGLFVRLLELQAPGAAPREGTGASAILGIAFVVAGSLAIAVSALQHSRFVVTLPLEDLPARYSRGFAVGLSLAVAALGLLLAAYLAMSPH
jgi:putative membrane protein